MRNIVSIMPKLGYIVLRGTKEPAPANTSTQATSRTAAPAASHDPDGSPATGGPAR
jgi:hypothetical protein